MRVSKPSYNSVWIGRVGETGATDVVFPLIEGWDNIEENTYGLIVVRPGETTPYPCPITIEEDGVHWTPNSGDLLYAGKGKAEVILTGDYGEIVKSVIYQTVVSKALTDDTTDPPAPWESYVETVLAAGAKAENMTATASVDDTEGTPAVTVTKTETDVSYNLDFAFSGLKQPTEIAKINAAPLTNAIALQVLNAYKAGQRVIITTPINSKSFQGMHFGHTQSNEIPVGGGVIWTHTFAFLGIINNGTADSPGYAIQAAKLVLKTNTEQTEVTSCSISVIS